MKEGFPPNVVLGRNFFSEEQRRSRHGTVIEPLKNPGIAYGKKGELE